MYGRVNRNIQKKNAQTHTIEWIISQWKEIIINWYEEGELENMKKRKGENIQKAKFDVVKTNTIALQSIFIKT